MVGSALGLVPTSATGAQAEADALPSTALPRVSCNVV